MMIFSKNRMCLLYIILSIVACCSFLSVDAVLDGTNGTSLYLATNYTFTNYEFARGYVRFADGFTLPGGGMITLSVHEPVSGNINLKGGMITLNSDLFLASGAAIIGEGTIDLNGHTLYLDGDMTLTNDVFLGFNGGKVEGRGHRICTTSTGELSGYDTLFSLTYSNIRFEGLTGPSNLFSHLGNTTLYNTTITVDDESTSLQLPANKLHIFGDVEFSCPNSDVIIGLMTGGFQTFIHRSSRLFFKNSTFVFYGARNTFFEDRTAVMHLQNCRFLFNAAGAEGLPLRRLNKGTIIIDGNVEVIASNIAGLKFGDGTSSNEPRIIILPSSTLDFSRSADFTSTTSFSIIYAGVH